MVSTLDHFSKKCFAPLIYYLILTFNFFLQNLPQAQKVYILFLYDLEQNKYPISHPCLRNRTLCSMIASPHHHPTEETAISITRLFIFLVFFMVLSLLDVFPHNVLIFFCFELYGNEILLYVYFFYFLLLLSIFEI